jgi:5-formyltetrahydrofolate cyclo-ligase
VILEKLLAVSEFQKSETMLFYASFDGEVDTWPMMKRALNLGKKIALPKIIPAQKRIIPMLINDLQKDLDSGPYGIKQPLDSCRPVEIEELDLVVVPGIAFDRQNRRLGRGGGYYDRFLAELSPQTPKIGLAFDFQIVDRFPVDTHDVAVTRVICN